MIGRWLLIAALVVSCAVPSSAQLGMPGGMGQLYPHVGGVVIENACQTVIVDGTATLALSNSRNVAYISKPSGC